MQDPIKPPIETEKVEEKEPELLNNKELAIEKVKQELCNLVPENITIDKMTYVSMVKDIIMGKDRSMTDFKLFLYQARKTGLDPLAKQIYAVFRWSNKDNKEIMTIQTGIDGYRLIAQRTGEYAGSDDVIFDEKDGKIIKATITVYRLNKFTGERMPITASARWEEYVPMGTKGEIINPIWRKMPYLMLGKVSEALALRKAFPAELSGVYTLEEMEQASIIKQPQEIN